MADVSWRKSSGSAGAENCVELAYRFGVRDSKDPSGVALAVTATGFDALVAAARQR